MSAPAEALAKFWEDLRGKARVEIDHPDLPEALKEAAGQAVSVSWTLTIVVCGGAVGGLGGRAGDQAQRPVRGLVGPGVASGGDAPPFETRLGFRHRLPRRVPLSSATRSQRGSDAAAAKAR